MKTIQNKWKEFAIGQFFSSDDEVENTVEIFDALMEVSNEEEFEALLEKSGLSVWQPFEQMYYHDFLFNLENCAMTAQRYEVAA
jgi:hypothetical protein